MPTRSRNDGDKLYEEIMELYGRLVPTTQEGEDALKIDPERTDRDWRQLIALEESAIKYVDGDSPEHPKLRDYVEDIAKPSRNL